MGWLNIPLDMATLPIACIVLGIVVDDTIHYFYWYKKTRNVSETLGIVGPGILYSSVIIVLGFSILLVADSPPVRYLAIFCVCGFLFASFADIILLSSLLDEPKKVEIKPPKEN
jgi:predicted RND superfamily exporter protein